VRDSRWSGEGIVGGVAIEGVVAAAGERTVLVEVQVSASSACED
jgi:hypothetical protein